MQRITEMCWHKNHKSSKPNRLYSRAVLPVASTVRGRVQQRPLLSVFPQLFPDSERCLLQRLVVPSTAYRAWVARVSAREEGECLFGSTELSVPAHKVIAQCTRTFVSHSDRSLGSGAWRIGNKNSPFGCRFSSVALGVSCFPPCSLLPLPAPGLPRDSGRLALNTTPSLLTSSPT